MSGIESRGIYIGQDQQDLSGGGTPRTGEHSLLLERELAEITPDVLREDNRSDLSKSRIKKFQDARDSGNLIIEDQCCDARPPEAESEKIVRLPSIAGSGPISPFSKVYADPRSKGIITKPHYSEVTFKLGQRPGGCGGGEGKETHMQNGIPAEEGDIDKWIKKYVPHSDVVINSLYRAGILARLFDKPVLATAAAHDTGKLSLLGWFKKRPSGSIENVTAIPVSFLFAGNYRPAEIYAEGVPSLDRGEVPDVFQERIQAHEDYIEQLKRKYNDFSEAQRVQNPKLLLISPNIKGPAIRYANTLGRPGSAFEVRFGRERIDEDITVDKEILSEALNQAHFPIARSVAHHEDDTKDFSRLNRILIETASMDLSLDLAMELADRAWMQDWMNLPNHRIMVARTRAGVTEAIDYLT